MAYQQVNTDDLPLIRESLIEDRGVYTSEATKRYGAFTFIVKASIFVIVCGIVLIIGIGYRSQRRHNASETSVGIDPLQSRCGNSSAEALSFGCSFDQLTWAWYPPHCPHYANKEFVQAEPEAPWRYYDNLSYSNPLHVEDRNWIEILDSGVELWTERREHFTHCVYLFLSAGQIVWEGGTYIPRIINSEHFEHCASLLLASLRQDSRWYSIDTGVPRPGFVQSC